MIQPKRMSKARLLELMNSSDLRANVSEGTVDDLLAHIAFIEIEAVAAAFDAGVWAHKYQHHALPTGRQYAAIERARD